MHRVANTTTPDANKIGHDSSHVYGFLMKCSIKNIVLITIKTNNVESGENYSEGIL